MRGTTTTTGRAVGALAAAGLLLVAGCSGEDPPAADGSGDLDGVTIQLAGPNQWNADPQSFGPFWEDLTARFQEETGVEVQTTVLPISEFSQTISTQLAAGTAPALVFNQPPHDPQTVVALDEYMEQPNPFVEGNERWYDVFDHEFFGYDAGSVNGQGNLEWVPFNLIGLGIFYNAEIFAEVGIEPPLTTYGDYLSACDDLRAAGYDGFAMDSSLQGQGQITNFISNMLMSRYFDEWNVYAGDGSEGAATTQLAAKSEARAMALGLYSAVETPEVAETLRLAKEFMDRCATTNWSGIAPAAGGFVNTADFAAGNAAMALGSNLAAADGVLDFEYGTMPFGTVTQEDSPLSTEFGAQSGLGAGGTSYMISATTEGPELEAAIAFLQFASSPEGIQPFLDASGGIPAIVDAEPAPGLEGLTADEDWTSPMLMGDFGTVPASAAGQPVIDGFLIGDQTLEDQLAELQALWDESVAEQVEDNGWTDDWTSEVG
ncbi:ABC transporter substrate-binding protein [Pseudactinotalea terrae]|uniref:ABC transporter substrate-binding protein n=1 Tax=Pseudactinotalea terrae TaxID=1743262 RepID=UPI0012E162BF|nr:ABC transporter substrate-binding protein [Pseudactinotalea terrae]